MSASPRAPLTEEQLEEKREEWLEAFGRVYQYVPLSMYDEATKLAEYAWEEMFGLLAAQQREIGGPSGLREELVAARKGEQIEFRMRKRAEEKLAAQQAVIDAARFYREMQRRLALSPIRITPAHLDAARDKLDETLAVVSPEEKP
jgi:hypothetical protein